MDTVNGSRQAPRFEGRAGRGPGADVPSTNVYTIARLEAEQLVARSLGERASDRIARIAGNGWCLLLHAAIFALWIGINAGMVPALPVVDPYPFSALTTAVSLEAIFLAIVLLISQNRMTRQADRRAHLDLQINLLAEQETTATLRILRLISERLGIPPEAAGVETDLEASTDVERIATELDRKLPG